MLFYLQCDGINLDQMYVEDEDNEQLTVHFDMIDIVSGISSLRFYVNLIPVYL